MTKRGGLDAGYAAQGCIEDILAKDKIENLDIRIEGEGRDRRVDIILSSGESLSRRLLREGYAVPDPDQQADPGALHLTKQARALKMGLWAQGFPEGAEDWRQEARGIKLGEKDKRENLVKTVGASMVGSAHGAYRVLSDPDSKLFAMPIKDWTNMANVDREISRMVGENPDHAMSIYANNMEILKDLRSRTKTLSDDEKRAHDRLSIGRRALAKALVDHGEMTMEEAQNDGHRLLSKEAKLFGKGFRENMAKVGTKTVEIADAGINKAGKGIQTVISEAVGFAVR